MLDYELNQIDIPKDLDILSVQHNIDVIEEHCLFVRNKLQTKNEIQSVGISGLNSQSNAFAVWNGKCSEVYITLTPNSGNKIRTWFQMQASKRSWLKQIISLNNRPNDRKIG